MVVLRREITRDNTKAGRYELLDDQWDELVNGWPFDDRTPKFVRHTKGEVLELDDETAFRLMRGGCVAPEGERQEREYRRARAAMERARASLPPEMRDKVDEEDLQRLVAQRETGEPDLMAQAVNPGHPQYANATVGEVGVVDSHTSEQAVEPEESGSRRSRKS